jgi:hypothetical protein
MNIFEIHHDSLSLSSCEVLRVRAVNKLDFGGGEFRFFPTESNFYSFYRDKLYNNNDFDDESESYDYYDEFEEECVEEDR